MLILLTLQRGNHGINTASFSNTLLKSSASANYVVPKRRKTDIGPKTLELQNKLGNLPVPNINDTIAKFLISSKHLLNDEEFVTTAKKLLELAQPNGIGEKLQEILLQRKEEKDNWVRNGLWKILLSIFGPFDILDHMLPCGKPYEVL